MCHGVAQRGFSRSPRGREVDAASGRERLSARRSAAAVRHGVLHGIDSLCDTSFNGIGYALRVEMLDEVTKLAWHDARELERAAAKRLRRRKRATK